MLSNLRDMYEKALCRVRDEKGQGLVEYALILVLIAIVVILAVQKVGTQTSTTFSAVASHLSSGN